jgi:hypothetical protein
MEPTESPKHVHPAIKRWAWENHGESRWRWIPTHIHDACDERAIAAIRARPTDRLGRFPGVGGNVSGDLWIQGLLVSVADAVHPVRGYWLEIIDPEDLYLRPYVYAARQASDEECGHDWGTAAVSLDAGTEAPRSAGTPMKPIQRARIMAAAGPGLIFLLLGLSAVCLCLISVWSALFSGPTRTGKNWLFAFECAVFGTILLVCAWRLLVFARRLWRHSIGLCAMCGYRLGALPPDECPRCASTSAKRP